MFRSLLLTIAAQITKSDIPMLHDEGKAAIVRGGAASFLQDLIGAIRIPPGFKLISLFISAQVVLYNQTNCSLYFITVCCIVYEKIV